MKPSLADFPMAQSSEPKGKGRVTILGTSEEIIKWRDEFEAGLRAQLVDDDRSLKDSTSPQDKKYFLGKIVILQKLLGGEEP